MSALDGVTGPSYLPFPVGKVVDTYNPSTLEAEAGGLQVQAQPRQFPRRRRRSFPGGWEEEETDGGQREIGGGSVQKEDRPGREQLGLERRKLGGLGKRKQGSVTATPWTGDREALRGGQRDTRPQSDPVCP